MMRKVISILAVYSCLSPSAATQKVPPAGSSTIPPSSTMEARQHFSETVVPIASIKITPSVKLGISGKLGPQLDVGAYLGTGFCLDPPCRFIATNYHVAMTTQAHKVKGEKIIERYFATGPDDEGATPNFIPNVGPLPYATKRDLAIFELGRSLPHHHGLSFSLDELQVGQEVDIYGYPRGTIAPIRTLTRFPATFKGHTTSGLLAFDYQLSADEPIRVAGASGGIVIVRKTEKIVGILSETTETTALAVPVQTLVEFVSKVKPFLAARIFPTTKEVSPISADLYPKFAEPPTAGLEHRPDEPAEVKVLREKAQFLADSIRNFIAVQTFEWGSGENNVPVALAEYEVRVVDGNQRFREYPEGKKELEELPLTEVKAGVGTGGEWSELPQMVGMAPKFKIHQFPDSIINGRRIKIFQYRAEVEDGICVFKEINDFLLFKINKVVTATCYGEVWTDEDTNILRISVHLDLSGVKWRDYQSVVTYGWLRRTDEAPRLVPLTISTQAKYGKKIYWCRGAFMHYQVFSTRVKFLSGSVTP
jgi:hypothetical protein